MAVRDGNARMGDDPYFLVWVHPHEDAPVEDSYQLGEPHISLEDAMTAATIHAANGRSPYRLEFELHTDDTSDVYFGETEEGVMYTIHGVVPSSYLN